MMDYIKYTSLSKQLMILAVGEANELEDKLHQAAEAIDVLCTLHKVASDKVRILTDILYKERAERNKAPQPQSLR